MNLKTNHSKAVGGQKAMCCFSQLFALAVAKERKGFLNYGLYSVLCLVAHLFIRVSLEYAPLRHNVSQIRLVAI